MNQRLAAALIGTTMGLATFAGSTIAVSVAAPEEEPRLSQDQVSKVICRVLEDLDLLDHPELKDLVKELGCKKSAKPTKTTTKTKTT